VTAAQLEAAARDAIRTAVRERRVDRATLVTALERNTRLSRADAEQIADRIEVRVTELRGRAEEFTHDALQAAETTGKVLLVLSILMILGLGASVAGAVASVRRERREHVVLPRAQTTVRSTTGS
jgi:hypothetical protein